jgi:hypothetical protein
MSALIKRTRMVAIEFGMWRSGLGNRGQPALTVFWPCALANTTGAMPTRYQFSELSVTVSIFHEPWEAEERCPQLTDRWYQLCGRSSALASFEI